MRRVPRASLLLVACGDQTTTSPPDRQAELHLVSGGAQATTAGSTSQLCGRVMTLTGYPTHQLHPEFAGFGMPPP